MPFLHIEDRNKHKEVWKALASDRFEVLEWSLDQDRDLIQRSYPEIDTQLFPRSCVTIAASLQKLADYGGISVRGEDVKPIRNAKILIADWKSLGPPQKLTVRGYDYPVMVDKSTIMASAAGDSVCKLYRDKIVDMMRSKIWVHPEFTDDVLIM